MKAFFSFAAAVALTLTSCVHTVEPVSDALVLEGDKLCLGGPYDNFVLTSLVTMDEGSVADLYICSNGKTGYRIRLHNGPCDGSIKTGSLVGVRNLYRSLASDDGLFDLTIAVRGKNIEVKVSDETVVRYTEPEAPYRTGEFAKALIQSGNVYVRGLAGKVRLSDVSITPLPADAACAGDRMPAVDETTDRIIRLQQAMFPVIDYHVHLKGGLSKEMAHEMSMNYGINYGIAPNAGEGGVGRMLADDAEVYEYYDEVKNMPFLPGVQGEGRKWTFTFSQPALGIFDYLFTDAMTIVDHKGRLSRIYRKEEVFFDDITYEGYMDMLVSQIEKILTNEPADFYANPTFLPEVMQADYDKFWTDERINRVLDVLQENDIALEINARYRIPSFKIISMAKARGIKFVFGTNNADADFGRLEYCIDAVEKCGLTADDIWFPTMSVRSSRPVIYYNEF